MPAAPWFAWAPRSSEAGKPRDAAPASSCRRSSLPTPRKGGARQAGALRYFLGGVMGLMLPQSADSHLPEASMVIFSGLPLTVVVVFIFMV